MMRRRRLLLLGILTGVGAVVAAPSVRRALDQRRLEAGGADTPPAWPTLEVPPPWVPPLDGSCPPGYPIKANEDSGIYHVPGGRFYDRTKPERCYATSAQAERDGYRAAKA